jgi:prepilin-type N-terminal cleavage/methylation domain-containing protein
MRKNKQQGFSIIEMLLVLVIIGILATITFPFLYQAKGKAENGNAFASMRTISSAQVAYFSNHRRFGRLTELNAAQAGGLGVTAGDDLVRGKFTFQLSPGTTTDAQLRESYTIIATKAVTGNELPYVISLNQTGQITQILP